MTAKKVFAVAVAVLAVTALLGGSALFVSASPLDFAVDVGQPVGAAEVSFVAALERMHEFTGALVISEHMGELRGAVTSAFIPLVWRVDRGLVLIPHLEPMELHAAGYLKFGTDKDVGFYNIKFFANATLGIGFHKNEWSFAGPGAVGIYWPLVDVLAVELAWRDGVSFGAWFIATQEKWRFRVGVLAGRQLKRDPTLHLITQLDASSMRIKVDFILKPELVVKTAVTFAF